MAEKNTIEEAREHLKDLVDEQDPLRSQMKDDLAFCTLDQWPSEIRNERENDPNGARPCLTIDKINQYIVQVANDIRQNRPSIKVRPVDDNADVDTAKVYQGLVRHIEDRSNAAVAYAMGAESAIKIGMGYWRVTTEKVNSAYNEQEICIKAIPNAFQVYLGPHDMPDGSDTEEAFVVSEWPIKKFKRIYPKAKVDVEDFAQIDNYQYWRKEHTITVCEQFYCVWEGDVRRIKWRIMTGLEELDSRDWPGRYIPVVEVIGRESVVRGRRILWGLVRPAKDSLRMNNYWMSAITEKIGLAPKAPFVGAVGQFSDVEQQWKAANRENRAYLEYNPIDVGGNALPAPQRQAPAPIEAAMIGMTVKIEQDVKAALGMYKAAIGDTDSQQSGRAILALQKESDTGTMHFADNQAISIRHTGRIVVDLIPKIYDTRRVVRILGEDDEVQAVQLDPEQKMARQQVPGQGGAIKSIYNLGVGEYDVTTTVGPSYTTKRQEVATLFTELANSAKDPASASVMRYIAVKNSDFEQSDEAMKMLKALLPPPLQQLEGEQPIPPQVAAKMMQMQQMMQAMGEEMKKLQAKEQQAQAKIAADHQHAMTELELKKKVAIEDANLTRWKAALDARTKVVVAQIAAKQAGDEALIQAENAANIAFMESVADQDTAKMEATIAAETQLETAAMQPQGEGEQTQSVPTPGPSMRDVIGGLAQMMQQMGQMTMAMVQNQNQQHAELMAVLNKPKQIRATLPSGQPMTVTVN